MALKELRTFRDIQDAIMESMKYQSTDTVSRDRIKRNINMAYEEVATFRRWIWSRGKVSLTTEPYVASGTAYVTAGSPTITLTVAPVTSKKGYLFSANGYNEIYKIRSHTAGSTTLELENVYTGTTTTASAYKIWNEALPLPTDCRETVEVRHNFSTVPVENMGLQEFRRMTDVTPKAEGRPACYSTSDFIDPDPFSDITGMPASVSRTSSGLIKSITFASSVATLLTTGDRIEISGAGDYSYNLEAIVANVSTTTVYYTGTVAVQESAITDTGITVKLRNNPTFNRYRELLVYPSISQLRTTIHVDYTKLINPLENDDDEPAMPLADRNVLFYGGMWLSQDREKNPETSDKYGMLFERRKETMGSKVEDSLEKATFKVSRAYLQTKRYPTRTRDLTRNPLNESDNGGGSSSTAVTGTANTVAIFDDQGNLTGSTTVTTDALDSLFGNEALTTVLAGPNATSTIASWTASSYDSIFITFTLSRGSCREAGFVNIISDGSAPATASGATAITASCGVTWSADLSSGQLRLRAAVDNSQASTSVTVKYKAQKWLST